MKKVILLAIFILVVAGIAGAGYFYYRMNFANIQVDIRPNESLKYYIELKLEAKATTEITGVDIVESFFAISPSDEMMLREQIKQMKERELIEELKRKFPQKPQVFECRLSVLPTQVGSKYISEARVITEKCYEEDEGGKEDYSNKEYTVRKGEGAEIGDLNIITKLPYCLDFCDGKRVKKGEVIEGVALAEYLSDIGKKPKVNYIVDEIRWNTVTFKIDGYMEPEQEGYLTLQGKISGYAVYDRKKRLFTSLILYSTLNGTEEFTGEAFLFPVKAKFNAKFSYDGKLDMKIEIDR